MSLGASGPLRDGGHCCHDARFFNPALVEELKVAYDAEKQLLRALPKMRKAAFSEELSEAYMLHTRQREELVER
jgi:ferritin-like metal-binding protein YciE